jgi:hypothetical protein
MSFGPLKVTFKRASMEAETDFGSLSELAGALQEQGAALIQMFGSDMEAVITNLGGTVAPAETNEQTSEASDKKERKPRGPNKAKEVVPPTAPAPIPVGTVDMTPNASGIPAGLARDPATNTAPALAPPPVPPAPPAPPVPPSGVLAGKIIPHMEGIAASSTDGGKQWVDWLAASNIVVAGATFEEAMKVIRMQPDEKLAPIASALGIAA